VHARFLVIGGGLSGLAAAIRLARFNDDVLLLEKHSRVGGLNSYYYRSGHLFETGLHAITNFALKTEKKAPLNRLLRQLKISRDEIGFQEQIKSEIFFSKGESLLFSNDFNELCESVETKFKPAAAGFGKLVSYINGFDPFRPASFASSRAILSSFINDPLLVDMILCPLLYYGSSWENDIDFAQFVIMFRSIYQEGMFRPVGSIKSVLDLLVEKFDSFGGTLRLNCGVQQIHKKQDKVQSVTLEDGNRITCDYLISTVGLDETKILLGESIEASTQTRLGFTENIFQLSRSAKQQLPTDRTCIFFNTGDRFSYKNPVDFVDLSSGVICLPFNFQKRVSEAAVIEVRTTHLANHDKWHTVSTDKTMYTTVKKDCAQGSLSVAEGIIGAFSEHITFQDSFTPMTIRKFTGKISGAIYGSPAKAKDGTFGYANCFIAGTDQGFLGIVGSMLSGVSVVNQHILSKI